ncbi:hypothetical protein ABZ897_46150 [Nonomuraea sp. NPDC046802]|uniref:hypothetical protein n=1 Tax=Nonomuraea sp. NPDC046802 TaxID=3154919 RepID=UPI0033E07549
MYKHAIAAFVTTSTAFVLTAGTAAAEEAAPLPQICGTGNIVSLGSTPWRTTETSVDVRAYVGGLFSAEASIFGPSTSSSALSPVQNGSPYFLPSPWETSSTQAAPTVLSPVRTLLESLISRAETCSFIEDADTELTTDWDIPSSTEIDAVDTEELVETLAITPACGGPAVTSTTSEAVQTESVTRLFQQVITADPRVCAAPASSSRSLLDAIGVTGLLNGIISRP